MAFLKKNSAAGKRLIVLEENRTSVFLNIVVIAAVATVAYTDWLVTRNITLGYLYVLPIAFCALVNRLSVTIVLSILCTILQDIFGPPKETLALRLAHDGLNLAAYLSVALLVTVIAHQRAQLAAEVRRQRDEYERDLVLAAQVQQQVLPKPPIVPGLELAATMQTARLLGGDYYDFFQISDDIVDVVIADVSGKGAAASLLMPSLAVALRLRAKELDGPAAIIKDLDGVLKQITNSATFVTIFYARFHPSRRTLTYASGGHNPPLLYRPSTGESFFLEESGPIVGILPDFAVQFTNTTIQLYLGDILTLFTDGITEQENDTGEEFSLHRLKAIVLHDQSQPATTLVTDITGAVSTFAGSAEQSDDLTVVVAKLR